jgi:glycosyltransferase involved in cell wall biosynthesis
MRIAQVAPLYESVPPSRYGGTERVVAHLTNELVRRGHDVVLFASAESQTLAELAPCRDVALRLDQEVSWDLPAHLAMLSEVRARAHEFDLLHFHLECHHFPLFSEIADRTLTTLHGRLDIKDLRRLFLLHSEFPLVSISNNQREPVPFLRWMTTVHHGYPKAQFSFSAQAKGGYLAFLGRISPEKGVDKAIQIAKQAGVPLRIAAKVDAADRGYFKQHVEPLLNDPDVEFIGEIGEAEKSGFLGDALALLFPIAWPEPFGLVMIEAMGCGTPVIAFRHGSVPEIVEDGITGFVVDDVDEAVIAVKKVARLDRRAVRHMFEQRFSVEIMTDGYEQAYRHVLDLRRATSQLSAPENMKGIEMPPSSDMRPGSLVSFDEPEAA